MYLLPKNQHTTPKPNSTAEESSSSQQMAQQTFYQRLREQIRSATQMIMEEIMREELTQFLGAEWGECCVERNRLMQPEVTQYLMRATAELAELLGIAV